MNSKEHFSMLSDYSKMTNKINDQNSNFQRDSYYLNNSDSEDELSCDIEMETQAQKQVRLVRELQKKQIKLYKQQMVNHAHGFRTLPAS